MIILNATNAEVKYFNNIYSCPPNTFLLKNFTNYLQNNKYFIIFVTQFQNCIVQHIFGYEQYHTIKCKNRHYYSHSKKEPPEKCLNYINRVLFTRLPPPYYFEYGTLNADEKAYDEVLLYLRQSYGYSCRPSSVKEVIGDRYSLHGQFSFGQNHLSVHSNRLNSIERKSRPRSSSNMSNASPRVKKNAVYPISNQM